MSFWVRRIAGNFLLIGLLFLLRGEICQASMEEEQSEAEFMQQEMMEDLELSQVERAVDELLEEDVSFRELFQGLVKDGQISFDFSWEKVGLLFLADVLGIQKKTCIHILLLVLVAALFSGFSGVLENRQIGEISFYIVYLFLFVLLLKNFEGFSSQIQETMTRTVEFMRALLPAYYLAITAAEGVSTATLFYQMILLIILLAERVILAFLLPGVRIYFLVELTNYLTKEELLSKMAELLKAGIQWALKTIVGVILGLQLIQRLISPAVDALKRTIVGKTAEAIPGVGNLFSGVTEMILGSAVLIKNCLGAAALIILLLAAAPPVIRLGVSSVFYRFIAALVQPVTDNRMVGCIQTMGEGVGMLLRLLFTVEILFFLTIAILAGSLG